jgi:hypothetical protein
MVPSEDSTQSASSRRRRRHGAVAHPLMVWTNVTGLVLSATGVLLIPDSLWSTPTGLWQTAVALLFVAPGGLLIFALDPSLKKRGFSWPATFREMAAVPVNHPWLFRLAQVWFLVVIFGWVIAVVLLRASDLLFPTQWVPPLLGLVPFWAVVLFGRRRLYEAR